MLLLYNFLNRTVYEECKRGCGRGNSQVCETEAMFTMETFLGDLPCWELRRKRGLTSYIDPSFVVKKGFRSAACGCNQIGHVWQILCSVKCGSYGLMDWWMSGYASYF